MSTKGTEPADRVRFGIEGLDNVLHGGVMRQNHVLLEGPAGAGKTTLALSFLHAGATREREPGLLISFEISPAKLLRDARGFGWDLEQLIRQGLLKVIETTPGVLLQDLRVEDGVLASELVTLGAKRLVIDGLTPLRLSAERSSGPSYRSGLHQLIGSLTRLGVTTLVTNESDAKSGGATSDERYLFDTVIALDRVSEPSSRRSIEVIKSRGQDFVSGRHTLRLEAGRGVTVYQRAQSRERSYADVTGLRTVESFGSPDIDALFGGGLYGGSITMVSGIAGTGKTVASLQFLTAGALSGQPSLLVSLDEPPAQLLRNAENLELPIRSLLEGQKLFFMYESPLEIELDVHFDRIVKLVEEHGIKRVVFDSLALYEKANPEQVTGFLYAVAAFCKTRGILCVLNYESPELLGVSQISESLKGSQLVDNIVLLSYVEVSTHLRRAIAVPKVRGRRNLQITREYVIGPGGLSLVDEPAPENEVSSVPQLPFSAYYGLLARAPARRAPAIDEAIASGEPLPESQESSEEA
ncbi:MAG: ATPase domain-containing protein [Polyangiales bacterium]